MLNISPVPLIKLYTGIAKFSAARPLVPIPFEKYRQVYITKDPASQEY